MYKQCTADPKKEKVQLVQPLADTKPLLEKAYDFITGHEFITCFCCFYGKDVNFLVV